MILLWLPFVVEVVMASCHDECWSLVACCHEEGWCFPVWVMLWYITSLVVISFPLLLFPLRIIWLYCYYPRTSFLTFGSPLLLLAITSFEKSLLSVSPPFSSFLRLLPVFRHDGSAFDCRLASSAEAVSDLRCQEGAAEAPLLVPRFESSAPPPPVTHPRFQAHWF